MYMYMNMYNYMHGQAFPLTTTTKDKTFKAAMATSCSFDKLLVYLC